MSDHFLKTFRIIKEAVRLIINDFHVYLMLITDVLRKKPGSFHGYVSIDNESRLL